MAKNYNMIKLQLGKKMYQTNAYQLSINYKLQYYEFRKKFYFDEK
jgi:hypothetical protein